MVIYNSIFNMCSYHDSFMEIAEGIEYEEHTWLTFNACLFIYWFHAFKFPVG
jgi:hypothetical protein